MLVILLEMQDKLFYASFSWKYLGIIFKCPNWGRHGLLVDEFSKSACRCCRQKPGRGRGWAEAWKMYEGHFSPKSRIRIIRGMKYKMYKQYFSCFSTSPLTRQHNLKKTPPPPTHHSWRKPCYLNRNMVWFIKYITSLITSVLEQVSGAPWHRHSTYCICPPTAHAWHTEG